MPDDNKRNFNKININLDDPNMLGKLFDELLKNADFSGRVPSEPLVLGLNITINRQQLSGDASAKEAGFEAPEEGEPGHGPNNDLLFDIIDREGEIDVIAQMPRAQKDKIRVFLEGRRLSVYADGKDGLFRKEIDLPHPSASRKSFATLLNDVLEIRLIKTKRDLKGRMEIGLL
ncbi:MAG: Hsp20/alpha crystallin family protein [Candidatus Micrarchaeales archaeon]|jgi:CS domain.|uniref:SHSP domain-containing protein n=1 Tax=Candidatus Micrarchaeum acidiphilum ARMAN-2 TaxID=425595 RepID=C7DHR6_MICA2|nr:MAG: hypothetical protein UNLARM2_0608 [Candidatus Micrarchaeum acidiphilum ARMAN-2]MCW6160737.1 Hsp20/alpha crystallin family protein [Candidatus Micrarchaeales archaeon]